MISREAARHPERVGRYLVFAAFARGGMASVHLARLDGAPGITRLVAVKRMHPLYADSAEHARMLRDEARITSRVRHPNVVPLVDVIQDDSGLSLVMDYISGVSLAEVIQQARAIGEQVPPAIASAIVGDVLRGLHAAHEARAEDGASLEIVHRDMSPHNVLVGTDGLARVLDFGIAKALGKEHATMSGDLRGKLAYLAPEQLRGLPATRQSDLYAVGVVLRELLVAQPAAESPSLIGLAPPLAAIVRRALDAEPRNRFESAEEMAIALEAACARATPEQVKDYVERIADDELSRRAELVREVELFVPAPPTPQAPWRPTRHRTLIALATALAIGGLGIAAVSRSTHKPVAPAAEPPRVAPLTSVPTMDRPPADSVSTAAPIAASALPPIAAPRSSNAARPPTSRPGSSVASAQSDPCSAPFMIDDAGVKRYRRECL